MIVRPHHYFRLALFGGWLVAGVAVGLAGELSIRAWGNNANGQLGCGDRENRLVPCRPEELQFPQLMTVAAGQVHALALLADGTVRAWGGNQSGQLGDGTRQERLTPVKVSELQDVRAVAAGASHSLALRVDGTVWAWGANYDWQLGDPRAHTRPRAGPVPGVEKTIAIATDWNHSLALRADGRVLAWGTNNSGCLGPQAKDYRGAPTEVPLPGKVVAIAAGMDSSYALLADGRLYVWGANAAAQADEEDMKPLPPVPVGGVGEVAEVFAHGWLVAVRTRSGRLFAWGKNGDGGVGDGTTTRRFSPVAVALAAEAVLAAPEMAVLADGRVMVWGGNSFGQQGVGDLSSSLNPRELPGLSGVVQLVAGGGFRLAVVDESRRRGNVAPVAVNRALCLEAGREVAIALTALDPDRDELRFALAQPPRHGRLWGEPPNLIYAAAADYTGDDAFTFTVTDGHSAPATGRIDLNLKPAGRTRLWAWGANERGQLGDGTTEPRPTPVAQPDFSGIQAIAAGGEHALALFGDGTLAGWGDNNWGQLASSDRSPRQVPAVIPGVIGVKAIAAGNSLSVALSVDGRVWFWGGGGLSALAEKGHQPAVPTLVPGLTGAVAVGAGWAYLAALDGAGLVWAWGEVPFLSPAEEVLKTFTIPQASALAVGPDFIMACLPDGTVLAAGANNDAGQLGQRRKGHSLRPEPVPLLAQARALAAGGYSGYALLNDGTVRAWGDNRDGQLGNGQTTTDALPVEVEGLTEVVTLAAGGRFALALRTDGTVWAWGDNSRGQLGDGTKEDRLVPSPVPGLNGIVAVAAGENWAMALEELDRQPQPPAPTAKDAESSVIF